MYLTGKNMLYVLLAALLFAGLPSKNSCDLSMESIAHDSQVWVFFNNCIRKSLSISFSSDTNMAILRLKVNQNSVNIC